MGRLMRAPDGHDGGGDGADAGNDGADAGASQGGSDASQSDQGADGKGDGDQSTVLGDAGADEGAGDAGAADGEGGESGEADAGKDGEGKADDVVPEAYDLKLTVTSKDEEGKDVETEIEMDKVLLEKATPILKELKLTNEQANKLAPVVLDVQERMLQQQSDDHKAMVATWAREAEADKEIGGKNWKETQALAAKALDHFGAPKGSEFRQLLDDTGLGNHPTMIAMFRKIGASVKEDDKLERDTTNPQGKKDKLETLYPDDVPKK